MGRNFSERISQTVQDIVACGFFIASFSCAGFRRDEDLCFPSRPAVRKHLESVIRNLLSAEESCLNADGLKVDFYYNAPTPESHFHDPSWPKGEKLVYEVLKFIYDTAKQVKSDAFY